MSNDPEVMGRNAYARHRGVSPNAVSKAVQDGRIADAALMAGGRIIGIRWRLADRLWDENTDPAAALKNWPLSPAAAPKEAASLRFRTCGKRSLVDIWLPRIALRLGESIVDEAQLLMRNHGLTAETALEIVEEILFLHLGSVNLAFGRDAMQVSLPAELERALDTERPALLRRVQAAYGNELGAPSA